MLTSLPLLSRLSSHLRSDEQGPFFPTCRQSSSCFRLQAAVREMGEDPDLDSSWSDIDGLEGVCRVEVRLPFSLLRLPVSRSDS